jgi:hypothetical protein
VITRTDLKNQVKNIRKVVPFQWLHRSITMLLRLGVSIATNATMAHQSSKPSKKWWMVHGWTDWPNKLSLTSIHQSIY